MSVAYRVALAQTFQDALKKRSTHAHAVMEAIRRLQEGHIGTHLHALQGMPWVSFNVNRDALRIIAARDGDALLLAWVDLHDDAYEWARRHKPMQIGQLIEFVRVGVRDEEQDAATVVESVKPLADVRDKTFRLVEIDADSARILRRLSEDELLGLLPLMQPATGEALLALATDPDDLDTIVHRFEKTRAGATTSLSEAIKAPANSQRVWVLPDDVAVVERALTEGSAWEFFLHPSQRRLVEMEAKGPVLVTGGPGTGKTVVALHRARTLLRQTSTDTRPLLLTTFSRVLARQLESGLKRLCHDEPTLLAKAAVRTLTQAARDVCAAAGLPSALLLDEDLDAAWAEALALDAAQRGRRFYEIERRDVVLPQGVVDEAGYLKAKRVGRGERVDRAERIAIWRVLERFTAALKQRSGDDATGLAACAIGALLSGAVTSPWRGVVCDEVQDASLVELRLLALLGGTHLFLVGDGHQRLYAKPASLRGAGIEIRGRSVRLRLNYRTTQGICRAAIAAIDGVDLDVLDAEATEASNAEAGTELGGYRSVRAGPPPERHVCADADEEADIVARVIKESAPSSPTLVLARTRSALEAMQERLRKRGLTVPLLGDLDAPPTGVPAYLATLHRAKGLEAPTVVLTAMQQVPQPFRSGGDDEERKQHERQERLLVYVGMTRARDRCVLTRTRA